MEGGDAAHRCLTSAGIATDAARWLSCITVSSAEAQSAEAGMAARSWKRKDDRQRSLAPSMCPTKQCDIDQARQQRRRVCYQPNGALVAILAGHREPMRRELLIWMGHRPLDARKSPIRTVIARYCGCYRAPRSVLRPWRREGLATLVGNTILNSRRGGYG